MEFKYFSEHLRELIATSLPGERAHAEMMPINRPYTSDALKERPSLRESAVGILLFPKEQSLQSVLIQRPPYEGIHGNQISFPGGKMDPGDDNLEYTARRECFEEIQLPMGHGEQIGKLSSVYIPVSKFLVEPFIFTLEEEPNLVADEREVHSIIQFDILQLLDDSNLKKRDMRLSRGFIQKDIPYFDIHGHVVWGATAMMLAELRALLQMSKI